jgi:hypothetical protein
LEEKKEKKRDTTYKLAGHTCRLQHDDDAVAMREEPSPKEEETKKLQTGFNGKTNE